MLAVGSDVDDLYPGDVIIFTDYAGVELDPDTDHPSILMSESDAIATVSPSNV